MYKILKVKYENKNFPKTFSGREYIYYTTKNISIGDIVIAPTKFGSKIALVCDLENRIIELQKYKKEKILSIIFKLNREKFLKESKVEISY